jgi:hypothetical protein
VTEIEMSARLLEVRGFRIDRTDPDGVLNLAARCPCCRRPVVVAAAVTSRPGRLATIMSLLNDPEAERLVRLGGVVEVHSWTVKDGDRAQCEVTLLTPLDFPDGPARLPGKPATPKRK